jgi:hypothetical protein
VDIAKRAGYQDSLGRGDPETMKSEVMASDRSSQFDIYKDTKTGDYFMLGKGGKGVPVRIDVSTNRY